MVKEGTGDRRVRGRKRGGDHSPFFFGIAATFN